MSIACLIKSALYGSRVDDMFAIDTVFRCGVQARPDPKSSYLGSLSLNTWRWIYTNTICFFVFFLFYLPRLKTLRRNASVRSRLSLRFSSCRSQKH